MKQPDQVVIVGAGLVGALLATMLTRRGIRVALYEKRPDLRKTRISAGKSINLALAERGIHGLRLAGLWDEVEPLLIPMRGRCIHAVDGGTEFLAYGQRPDEVIYSVSRADLNRIMLDAVEQSPQALLTFHRELRSVNFEAQTLTFADTRTDQSQVVPFDFVIGADGSGSVLRPLLVDRAGGRDSTEFLDHDYKELHIPAGASGDFQMEKESLHIWPRGGFMLIALPNLDGSFTVTLFLPRRGANSFAELGSPDAVRQFFQRNFADAAALIPQLVNDFFGNPTGQMGTVRCWPWSFGDRALLIGDAAHAIVPFHGQGMNCGFEDCGRFTHGLDAHKDWGVASREFQAERKPDSDAIAAMALENFIEMRDGVRDPQFQLKKEFGFELERMFPKQFIPRYSMVMFHRIPYHIVLQRGKVQDEILDALIAESARPEPFDRAKARQLVDARLPPLEAV